MTVPVIALNWLLCPFWATFIAMCVCLPVCTGAVLCLLGDVWGRKGQGDVGFTLVGSEKDRSYYRCLNNYLYHFGGVLIIRI